MFKTLAQILLALNDLRTEFTSEDRMQICRLFQWEPILCFVVDEAQSAENTFQACRTWNKNQKRIGNFLDVFYQIVQDYLRF